MVYLLHFDKPYKHARHYLGFCSGGVNQDGHPDTLDARLARHAAGSGARLMAVIKAAGITFTLARTWPEGDRTFERALKHKKAAPRLCPICNPKAGERA